MELEIKNYAVINLGGIEIWITDTMVSTWIIMGILIVFSIFVRVKARKFKEVPKGFQNAIEGLVEVFESYLRSTVGDRLMFLGHWFFTLFVFILLSNLSGLFPGIRPPTADWSFTFGMAIVTFILIQAMGMKFRGTGYLKSFVKPYYLAFLFLPMNFIGELARPISISFRLFGNMLAGLIMMSLIYALAPVFAQFVIPVPLHGFFDVFSGILQTYIFCTLSMTFIAGATEASD